MNDPDSGRAARAAPRRGLPWRCSVLRYSGGLGYRPTRRNPAAGRGSGESQTCWAGLAPPKHRVKTSAQVSGYRSLPAYERLKLLLVTGKSGTIVAARASGKAGQLNHDGSTILTRVRRWSASTSTRCTMVPRHPSTMPTPLLTRPEGSWAAGPCAGAARKLSWSAVVMRWLASWVEAANSPARRVKRASTSPLVWVSGVTGKPAVGCARRASVARPLDGAA